MQSYERTLTALRREVPDRPPVFCYCDETTPGTSGAFREYVAAHADVFRTRVLYTGFQCTGLEPVRDERALGDGWIETTCRFEPDIRFTEVSKPGEKGAYVGYRKHLLAGRHDLERVLGLPWCPPAANPRLEEWLGEIRSLGQRVRDEGSFFRIAFLGPLGILAGAVNPVDFAVLTLEEPGLVRRYLDVALERQAAYLEHVLARLEVPAVMNIGGAEYAIPPLMAPTAFGEYVEPYDGPLITLMHRYGRPVYYHCHGKVRRFIPRFIAMGADGLHPLEPVGTTGDCDLVEVKREFGRDLCLIGNVQYDDLVRLPARDVERIVRDAMRAGGAGGFILSPSCTPYHDPMPESLERNIIAFVEAGLGHGAG